MRCAATAVEAVVVAAGEVAVVVVVAVAVAVDGLAVTTTPFATAAGKSIDTIDDTLLGNGLPQWLGV